MATPKKVASAKKAVNKAYTAKQKDARAKSKGYSSNEAHKDALRAKRTERGTQAGTPQRKLKDTMTAAPKKATVRPLTPAQKNASRTKAAGRKKAATRTGIQKAKTAAQKDMRAKSRGYSSNAAHKTALRNKRAARRN